MTITFENLNGTSTLSELLHEKGVSFPLPCGGEGRCGKCLVKANGHQVPACQYRPVGSVTVELEAPRFADGETAAVDIGSTNVVVLLDGERLISEPNVLRAYGSDVITRIASARQGHFQEMHRLLKDQIDRLTTGCKKVFISGNTIMECFYSGVDPSPIAVPPYTSPELFTSSDDLAPCVSGYVGGDIVSGLAWSNADLEEEPILYLDIGTNGELAVGNKEGFVTCACAAGPAFEYGLSGRSGTDVVDETARLVRQGLVSKSGHLKGDSFLSQQDIQSVMLAKAAIRAGIDVLTEGKEIRTLYLAGEFGKHLSPENACTIGLLPRFERVKVLGNASLYGAQEALLRGREKLLMTAQMCSYIELSTSKDFQTRFLKVLCFDKPVL